MRSRLAVFCIAVTLLSQDSLAETVHFGNRDTAFDIEFVEIGDPGNADETIFSQLEFIDVGRVDYVYQIGKFEVSREMVTKMVKASSDIELTLNTMEDIIGGPRPNMPATGVSWAEAARFVNWLNTSTGYDPAYNTFVSPGFRVWEPGDPGYDPSNPFRNSQAKFVLPSIDEWHKAAFFDPSLNGGLGGYWGYPTGSDEPPIPVGSGTEPGTAVVEQPKDAGPADIMEAGGLSPYGVMAMGGNAFEYEETAFDLSNDSSFRDRRGLRGLQWDSELSNVPIISNVRLAVSIAHDGNSPFGFRVAMLPDTAFGDFDRDGNITAADIDLLSEEVRTMTVSALFDLNEDGMVDQLDRTLWIEQAVDTHFGDADLNGTVELADFLLLSESFNQMNGWAGGDFDGNGKTEFGDFLVLSENFGKSRESQLAAVPEPSSAMLLLVGALSTLLCHRSCR